MSLWGSLKDYVSTSEGANKELTEKVTSPSREVEKLRSKVASLTSPHKKCLGEIKCFIKEKGQANKKVTELTTTLEEKRAQFENTVSELVSSMAHLEKERDQAVASENEMTDIALGVGKVVAQIRLLNPGSFVFDQGYGCQPHGGWRPIGGH